MPKRFTVATSWKLWGPAESPLSKVRTWLASTSGPYGAFVNYDFLHIPGTTVSNISGHGMTVSGTVNFAKPVTLSTAKRFVTDFLELAQSKPLQGDSWEMIPALNARGAFKMSVDVIESPRKRSRSRSVSHPRTRTRTRTHSRSRSRSRSRKPERRALGKTYTY